jgi:tetratricopeptide (TPR) repeat protein
MSKIDAANQTRSETITPLSVNIPPKDFEHARHRSRYRFGIVILLGALLLLVGAGVWFLNYLSKNPIQPLSTAEKPAAAKPQQPPEPVSTRPEVQTTQAAPAADPEQLARDKQLAEEKLADFLQVKSDLDSKGAADWGDEAYTAVNDAARQADALLIEAEFKRAAKEYDRAIDLARQLAGRTEAALQRLLGDGQTALADGNSAEARRNFSVALKIDSANQAARKGLKRSETIEEVHRLLKSGMQYEENNALSLARDDYRKAFQIDPEAETARQALARVSALLKDRQFRQLLSDGLTAYHNNDFSLARKRLLQAKSLNPSSRDVSEALFQVEQAIRLARINQLRQTAQTAEEAEDWQTALNSYQKVLDIDQNLKFAVYGRERARGQLRVAKRLVFYLAKPKVLESDEHLKNAVLLIAEAKEINPRGRKLADQINALQDLVTAAQTPVVVIIESDNLTRVAVYKVGKLGRFSKRALKLRPGTYTVVGARDGYQDVRQKIVVKPGQQALRVTVECRAKI